MSDEIDDYLRGLSPVANTDIFGVIDILARFVKVVRLSAVEALLMDPDQISDGLEAELYVYRDVVNGKPVPEYPGEPS